MRWNAIVDVGGTPPGLKGEVRDPHAAAQKIHGVAEKHGCTAEVWWDRYNWFAYVTLETTGARPDPRRALEELEAREVRPQLNNDEKQRHPWATNPSDPADRAGLYDDEQQLPPADEVESS